MNIPRLLVSVIVLTVFIAIFDFVVHGLILGSAYGDTKEAWRPEAEMMSRMWLQYVCYFVWSIGFACIWALAFAGKGAKCGAIYGFLVGLMGSSGMLINFVFVPIPDRFMLPWGLSGMVSAIFMGMLVAVVYQPKAAAATASTEAA